MKKLRLKKHILFLALVCVVNAFALQPSFSLTCSQVFISKRPLNVIEKLVFMTFNLENFVLKKGIPDKSPQQVQQIVETILKSNADIITLQEVQPEALDYLASQLGGRYIVQIAKGNDSRHIGFLVKLDLPLVTQLRSHKNMQWRNPNYPNVTEALFSRDLPVLDFYRDNNEEKPIFSVYGMHFHSKMDRDMVLNPHNPNEKISRDPKSYLKRNAEIEATLKIVKEDSEKYGSSVPQIIMGDVNADIPLARELNSFRLFFSDVFNLTRVPSYDRISHIIFMKEKDDVIRRQVDGIFVNSTLARFVEKSFVMRYSFFSALLPRFAEITSKNRGHTPSDHSAVVAEVSTKSLFPEAHR